MEAGWKRVCHVDEVPADGMKEFKVNGTSVLIVHAGGSFAAFQAMCPHEAIPLADGLCDGSVITCLEHMWQFDAHTGAPVGDDAERGLKTYPLRQERDELYVTLEG